MNWSLWIVTKHFFMKRITTLLLIVLTINSIVVAQNKLITKNNLFNEINAYIPEDYNLFRASVFTYDIENNQQFVYDYTQKNLFRIQFKDFRVFDVVPIGNGSGSGPGEFRNPTSMCIGNTIEGKKLVVIDSGLSRVTVWDSKTGNLLKCFTTKRFSPFRVACTQSIIILFNSLSLKKGDHLVMNNESSEIGGIKDPQKKKNAFLDSGYLVANSKSVFNSSQGRLLLKKFDLEMGTQQSTVFIKPKIGENKIDREKQVDYLIEKRDKDFIYQSRGIGIFENYVLVLHSGRKDAYGNTIEFYDQESLECQFSAEIDLCSQYMSVSAKVLLVRGFDQDLKKNYF